MRMVLISAVLLSTAQAKDVALILSDSDQRDLVQILDSAVKSKGLELVTPTSHIWEKLKVAPVVTERKDDAPTVDGGEK
jgi:hypothetical protein